MTPPPKRGFACVPVEYNGEFLWCIFEYATDQVINHFYFEDDANNYLKFLQRGGCFDSFTPTFIIQKIKTTTGSINKDFQLKI